MTIVNFNKFVYFYSLNLAANCYFSLQNAMSTLSHIFKIILRGLIFLKVVSKIYMQIFEFLYKSTKHGSVLKKFTHTDHTS